MNWFATALMLVSRLPLDKFLIKARDPTKDIERLEALINKTTQPPAMVAEKPQISVNKPRGVSNEETIAYQKRELGKELLLLEKHLQQHCKIGGTACDCCLKHPIAIEALAQETLGMTGDPLFNRVAEWAKDIAPMTTVEASTSGQYEEQYPQLAVKARSLRKEIMGTDEVGALLTPELSEKVKEQVEEIVSRITEEGGNNG